MRLAVVKPGCPGAVEGLPAELQEEWRTTKSVSDAYLGSHEDAARRDPRAPLFEIFPDNPGDLGATVSPT